MDWHSEKLHYINSYVFPLPQTLNIFHLQCLKFCPCLSFISQTESTKAIPKGKRGQKQNKKPNMVWDTQQDTNPVFLDFIQHS